MQHLLSTRKVRAKLRASVTMVGVPFKFKGSSITVPDLGFWACLKCASEHLCSYVMCGANRGHTGGVPVTKSTNKNLSYPARAVIETLCVVFQ